MDKNNGGSAFPVQIGQRQIAQHEFEYDVSEGMTLRDYFAAKAMQGLLADSTLQGAQDEFAARSYQMADAMLRAKGQ